MSFSVLCKPSAADVDFAATVISRDVDSIESSPAGWESVETSTEDDPADKPSAMAQFVQTAAEIAVRLGAPPEAVGLNPADCFADPQPEAVEAAADVKPEEKPAQRGEFYASRKALLDALKLAESAAARRSPRPAYKSVRLSINGTVRLSAFDGEQSADVNCDFERSGDASILVDPKRLAAALKSGSRNEYISMMIDGEELKTASLTIPAAVPIEEFPAAGWDFDPADIVAEFYVDAQKFAQAVKRTEFATDPECSRYALGGILVEAGENIGCILAATDSRRLSVCAAGDVERFSAADDQLKPIRGEKSQAVSYVVPVATMLRVAKAAEKSAGDVHIIAHRSPGLWNDTPQAGRDDKGNLTEEKFRPDPPAARLLLTFRIVGRDGLQEFTTPPLDGRFPDYRAVIPASYTGSYDVDSDQLAKAVKLVGSVTTEESRGIDFRFSNSLVGLSAKTSEGSAADSIPCSGAEDVISRTFDPRFITEFCAAIPRGSVVTWKLNSGDGPAVLEFTDTRYVVMPLSRD